MWAAVERVRPDGQVVIQSQHPDHYAIQAVLSQDRGEFYKHELRFRAELGYPPFRRFCRVSVRARQEPPARALADACGRRLREAGLTVYPATPDRRGLVWRLVVKGQADLPARVAQAVAEPPPPRARGIIEVEMDPVD